MKGIIVMDHIWLLPPSEKWLLPSKNIDLLVFDGEQLFLLTKIRKLKNNAVRGTLVLSLC